jgi:hypothetical protein
MLSIAELDIVAKSADMKEECIAMKYGSLMKRVGTSFYEASRHCVNYAMV